MKVKNVGTGTETILIGGAVSIGWGTEIIPQNYRGEHHHDAGKDCK